MNCVDWQERIALHAGGDASPGEASEVEQHLGECPGCQVFWSGLKDSLDVLREVHGELPEAAYFTAVRARVIGELERSRRVWRRLAWISGVAAILVFIVALWPGRTTVPVPPRMAAAIPQAPLVMPARLEQAPRHHVAAAVRTPITVQLQTSDPNIVIYWIAE
jgi:hypothetical protein